MKFALIIFLTLISLTVKSQITYDFDTIRYSERITGGLDSIDIKTAYLPTTFDGGKTIVSQGGLSPFSFFNQLLSPVFQPDFQSKKMKFSGLPHLGFTYSIGGQGSQFLRATYSQAVTKKLLINIDYERNSGQGSIRNASFSNDNVKLQAQRLGERYAFTLKGGYQQFNTAHPGGVVTDTLIETFGIEFSPVRKENAQSRNRKAFVEFNNFFDFLKDSATMLGLTTNHNYSILNRNYTESDTLFGIYNAVYIDSFDTRDQYNLASISNGVGAFYSSRKFYLDALVNHSYWDYQNLGAHQDSNEVDFSSRAFLQLGKFRVENTFKFNLLGRFNEFNELAKIRYSWEDLRLSGFLHFENRAPSVFQRKYASNNANYKLSNVENQKLLRFNVNAGYGFLKNRIKLNLFAEIANVTNPYLFNGSEWQNNTGSYNFSSFGLKSAFSFGVINFNPTVIYALSTSNYTPDLQVYGRLFVKGRLFKAKKLEALIGVDGSYISTFTTRAYLPAMDTYNWQNNSLNAYDPMFNLHAFLSLGISEFRFFLRYENIGYFWSDKTSEVSNGYPISPPRMRIGLTWDFFN